MYVIKPSSAIVAKIPRFKKYMKPKISSITISRTQKSNGRCIRRISCKRANQIGSELRSKLSCENEENKLEDDDVGVSCELGDDIKDFKVKIKANLLLLNSL